MAIKPPAGQRLRAFRGSRSGRRARAAPARKLVGGLRRFAPLPKPPPGFGCAVKARARDGAPSGRRSVSCVMPDYSDTPPAQSPRAEASRCLRTASPDPRRRADSFIARLVERNRASGCRRDRHSCAAHLFGRGSPRPSARSPRPVQPPRPWDSTSVTTSSVTSTLSASILSRFRRQLSFDPWSERISAALATASR